MKSFKEKLLMLFLNFLFLNVCLSASVQEIAVPENSIVTFAGIVYYERQINGHTDHTGDKKSNKGLTRKRAEPVKEYLTAAGIDKDRLTVKVLEMKGLFFLMMMKLMAVN